MQSSRWFLIWLVALTGVWVVASWHRAYLGSLKPHLVWAGLPWHFAHWELDRLEWFDPVVFAADVAIGMASVVLLAWLCERRYNARITSINHRE